MATNVDKTNVQNDDRVRRCTAQLNGKTYSYLEGMPTGSPTQGTIFLEKLHSCEKLLTSCGKFHGFPDLAVGWRYQIPILLQLRFHVIAIDCLGYGETDAPTTVESYSYRSLTEDVKELAAHLKVERVIACGHDWGANLAYRLALWYPSLVSHVIAICVPYFPSQGKYIPLEELSKTVLPNFAYQLQFKNGNLERVFRSRDGIRPFLVAMFGGRDNQGNLAWDAYSGLMIDKMAGLKPSGLLTDEVY
ncbi:Epoxide hydrolase [Penicillium lagena]|uniref:Epoxide hydrolase n=1 Tax=Penicillium lagena TaxID=94218 RepID=UPI00253F7A6C|nr:Epoxide hydrolase [Penicillium lagena]KAJ5620265.1 Epoxide hydrolase [Penicillium lagena]